MVVGRLGFVVDVENVLVFAAGGVLKEVMSVVAFLASKVLF